MRNQPQNCRFRFAARVAIVLTTAVGIAHADPRPRSPDAQDAEIGRKRFAEGVAAMKSGKFEQARLAFQQSYAVKPGPPALRNLATAELRTGRYLEAARHFTTYLKTTKPSEIDRAEAVQQGLAEAKSHCGMLLLEANVDGAEIGLDGETIGRTPMGSEPWLVEPGEHVITTHLDGYDDHRERQRLEAGRTMRISVVLQASGVARPAALPETTSPAPAEKLASSPEGRWPGSGEEARALPPSAPYRDTSTRVAIAPLAIGGAITVAGLALGIGSSVASSANASDRDALLAKLPGPSPKCGNTTPHADACQEVQSLGDRAERQRNVATAGFVVAGVAGAATLAYWLWPRSSGSRGMVVPTVAPTFAGVQWQSSF